MWLLSVLEAMLAWHCPCHILLVTDRAQPHVRKMKEISRRQSPPECDINEQTEES